MSLRSLVRRFLPAVAAVTLALPAAEAAAQPITYRFTGFVEGSLGGFTLTTPTAFTLDFSGNASNVFSVGSGVFLNGPLAGSASLAGLGSTGIPAAFDPFVFVAQNGFEFSTPAVGFGFGGTPLFALFNDDLFDYDLTTAFGPVSGQVLTIAGESIRVTDGTFEAFGGVSTVPEPSSYALMATGLVGIAGAAIRRRKQAA